MAKKKLYRKVLKPHILITSILALALVVGILNEVIVRKNTLNSPEEVVEGDIEELIEPEREADLAIVFMDTAKWIRNKTDWFGFTVKYPNTWKKMPSEDGAKTGKKYDYKYTYRDPNSNTFLGFDIKIYDKKKVADVLDTNEIVENKKIEDISSCKTSSRVKLGEGEYYAKEINIGKDDLCLNEMLFYSFDQNGYIYNVVPVFADIYESDKKVRNDLITYLPEYFTVVANIGFSKIVRVKPQPRYPGAPYPAPYPISHKKVNGKRVCAHDDDDPHKSDQGKEKHWDQQCCLDPDEWPNPYCTYDPKVLKKFGW